MNALKKLNEKTNRFGAQWAEFVIKFRWPVLIGTIAFAMLAGTGGQYMGFNSDYHVFFSDENPQMLAYDALQNKYTKDDNVYIAIEPQDKNVFTRETLAVIEDLTTKAWQTPYSNRVDAITNYQYTRAVEDDLYVDDLVEDAASKTDEEIANIRFVATHDPLLKNRLVNPEGTLTGINITVKLPAENPETGSKEVVEYLRELVAQIEKDNPNIKTYMTGTVMLSNAFQEAAFGDMASLVPLMFLIIIIAIFLFTRTITGTISAVVVMIFSIMVAAGLGGWLGIKLTPPSAAFMTIIVTLAVADSIHLLISIMQNLRRGAAKEEAIIEAVRVNFAPVFLTTLTTVIGFLSFNFGDVPPFHDLGNLVAMGMTAAFLLSVLTLPAMMSILPVRAKVKTDHSKSDTPLMDKLANFVINNRNPVLAGTTGLIIIFGFLATKNTMDERFVDYFDHSIAFRTDSDFISENLTGIYTAEFSVGAGEADGINDPAYLKKLEEFERWLEEQPGVLHVNSFAEVARKVNRSMHGDSMQHYKIPQTREEAAQYLLLYEMSLPYGLDLNNQMNVDKSETRLIATLENMTSNRMIQFGEQAENWLKENAPEPMFANGTSQGIMFSYLTRTQIYSMMKGNILALILISFILILSLKSLRNGLISIIPNVTPVIIGFGIWALVNGTINSGLSIVFGMTLGIIVDDTIHFLSKYLRARREKGLSPEDSIRYAFTTVGQALVVTTFILCSGFFVLAQSSFSMNSGMALITSIIILAALVIDFLLLPALLLLISGKSKNEQPEKSKLQPELTEA